MDRLDHFDPVRLYRMHERDPLLPSVAARRAERGVRGGEVEVRYVGSVLDPESSSADDEDAGSSGDTILLGLRSGLASASAGRRGRTARKAIPSDLVRAGERRGSGSVHPSACIRISSPPVHREREDAHRRDNPTRPFASPPPSPALSSRQPIPRPPLHPLHTPPLNPDRPPPTRPQSRPLAHE